MNPAKRKLTINLAILDVLKGTEGFLLPQDALFQQTKVAIRPTLLLSEFEDCLKGLEQLHFVVGIGDEINGEPKWKLTDLGKAKLATAEL
jgi:hypothetical protein